jgi:heavy metal efflux system protein
VRTYYNQIEYLQINKIKLQSLDSLYGEFIRVANLRYKTGDIKKIEISTAETKKGEINLLAQQNEIYLLTAYRNLKTIMNSSDNFTIAKSVKYVPLQLSQIIDSSFISNHPSIQSIYQQIQISDQTKKLEKAQAMPDVKLGYTNQSLIGIQNIDGQDQYFGSNNRFNVFNIGLSIPLTLGATNAKLKNIELQKQSLTSQAQYQSALLNSSLQNSLLQYQQEVKQYNYYLLTALPNASEIIKSAQLGYKTGDVSYVEYLFALQTATDIELKYLQSIQQLNQTVINIYSLLNN